MGAVRSLSRNSVGTAGDVPESPRHNRRSDATDGMPKPSSPIRFVPTSLGFRLPSQIYSDDGDSTQKRGLSVSKSRRFWLVVGLSLLLIVIVAIVFPLYFVRRSHDQSTGAQADHISNSYLVDIKSSEDESIRAMVLCILVESDISIDKMSLQTWTNGVLRIRSLV
jgi:hypothetical protein